MAFLDAMRDNLLSPPILFFFLGTIAGMVKSDLALPKDVVKGLSIYLLIAIGFEGGVKLGTAGLTTTLIGTSVVGLALGFMLPIAGFIVLRRITDPINAAAIAAHYGSVSVVTYLTATTFLSRLGLSYEPFMVALMAIMEFPAIMAGLILARRFGSAQLQATGSVSRAPGALSASSAVMHRNQAVTVSHTFLREVLFNGSVLLLVGSLAIGLLTGDRGLEAVKPALIDPFKGVLTIFLLDMGLTAGRGLGDFRKVGVPLGLFGLVMPLFGGSVGLLAGTWLGLSLGGATLLAVLAASASYIAVPAAMRMALPQANPALSLTMALGITFPFNIAFGIPLYHSMAKWIASLVG